MNFSGISNKTIAGQILRFPLKLIPSQLKVPILQGKLKGKRWIVGSSQHGCWLGSYEYDKQVLFEKTIHEGSIVFDIGAHVGFYSLLASELVSSSGKVFAFEPLPANLAYLKEHLKINSVRNTTVIEAAVCDRMGNAFFEVHSSSFQGSISSTGQLQVKTVCLDELINQGKIPVPHYLKIDVEGAEVEVLNGAQALLAAHHPTIFLATHGDDLHEQCCNLLTELGYKLQSISGKNLDKTDEIFATFGQTSKEYTQ